MQRVPRDISNYKMSFLSFYCDASTVHFGYSGHLSGHYIRLATISDLNIIEYC